MSGEPRTYYGQPVIKEPIWTWEIPCYFFTGGLAGASAGLAYLARLRGNDTLARRAWAAALVGVTASPALLVSDLGRPARFLNMLRMFKVTSPMSVGSWILSASGAATTVATANAWTGRFATAASVARPAAATLGLPLSTYTAALVANTAVPIWHEARGTLSLVFAAGAATSAGAAAAAATPVRHAAPARRLAVGGAVAELVTVQLMERQLGDAGEPYHEGRPGLLTRAAKALVGLGGATIALHGARSRRAAVVGGALLAVGAFAERWAVYEGGFKSASDPSYMVEPQRRRIDAGETRGAARRDSRPAGRGERDGSPATAERALP